MRFQSFFGELQLHKRIDRVEILVGRSRGLDGFEGPMTTPCSAFLDPRLETFFFLLAERAPQFRRWHDLIHILAVDANKEFTRVALLRINDGQARGGLPLGCGFLIQPQIALAGLGVGTMVGIVECALRIAAVFWTTKRVIWATLGLRRSLIAPLKAIKRPSARQPIHGRRHE